jgi:PHS family inorganic phosphate transporter-like MFS transporter
VYPDLANRLSKKQDFAIKVAAPIGNLFGQLLFGWLADLLDASECVSDLFYHLINIINALTASNHPTIDGIELMIIVTATFARALLVLVML